MKISKAFRLPILLIVITLAIMALASCENCEHELIFMNVIKEPTCADEGSELYLCTKCGKEVTQSITTLAHDFDEGVVTQSASFNESGVMKYSCKTCGATSTEDIDAFGKYADTTLSTTRTDIDLTKYAIVRSNVAPAYPSAIEATRLAAAIKASAGIDIACNKQFDVTETDYEILIGVTDRAESRAVLAEIEGEGFAIRVVDSKLVIVGTNDVQTATAVQYFINNYLCGKVDTTLSVRNSTLAYSSDVVTLMTSDAPEIDIVYDKYLDDDEHHAYTVTVSTGCRDYPVQAADLIAKNLSTSAKLDVNGFTVRRSDTTTENEIFVGPMNEGFEKIFRASLGADEYGILVTDEKVYITAHNDYALEAGVNRFRSITAAAAKTTADNKKEWTLPVGFCYTASANENWVVDFPSPEKEGITFINSLSLGLDTIEQLYRGEGVTAEAYDAYKAELISAGYSVYFENEIEGSKFATLTNDKTALYVAFNAFAHADEEHNTDDATHVTKYPYLDNPPTLRVVSSSLEDAHLPDSQFFTPSDYDKITESTITQVMLPTKDIGLCYIITLEDGSFVVFDGGWNNEDGPDRVWNALVASYKEVYKKEPTPEAPINVRAWYLTHSHNDHIVGFYDLYKNRKDTGLITVERLIGNCPDYTSVHNGAGDVVWFDDHFEELTEDLGIKYEKVFAGQVLHFANLEMEVLMTFSDHAPRIIDNANDTNTVVMMRIHNKDLPDVENTMLSLGDSMVYSSRFLCAMYGDYLECDTLTVAHHGNIGSEIAIYKLAQPTAVWYPHSNGGYNQYINEAKKDEWPYNVSNYIVRELESLKYVYVAGVLGAENSEAITLPVKADGSLDYENIYNVVTGLAVPYEENSLAATTTPAIKIPAK